MSHYHFHVRTPQGLTRDDEGLEYADLADATNDATISARLAIAEAMTRGDSLAATLDQAYEITPPDGQVVATVRFRDASEG